MALEMQAEDNFKIETCSLNCIEPNLWLGNLEAATNLSVLENKKIGYILTVDSCPLPKKISDMRSIQTKFIQVNDNPTEDLLSCFEEAIEFIDNSLKKGVVLVHCYSGVSRSSTLIISYLMKKKHLTLKSAYEFTKSRRTCIEPNMGFLAQLQLFETMKCNLDKKNVQFRMFRLYITAYHVKNLKIVPQCCADVIKADPSSLISAKLDSKVIKCRKCRRILAQMSNIIPHASKEKYTWEDNRWSGDTNTVEVCSQAYFIEPLSWMEDVSTTLEGKLYCPNSNCRCKLGSFSWIKGSVCPCGTIVSPGFCLIPSKVDRSNIEIYTAGQ